MARHRAEHLHSGLSYALRPPSNTTSILDHAMMSINTTRSIMRLLIVALLMDSHQAWLAPRSACHTLLFATGTTQPSPTVPQEDEGDAYEEVLADLSASDSSSPSLDLQNPVTDAFMDQALAEALQDSNQSTVMDDPELRAEIQEIFKRGNAKLLEGLEEIRREQEEYARKTATKNADKAASNLRDDQIRLKSAQDNMATVMDRVKRERDAVAQAVAELEEAQKEMEKDPIYRLKSGGIMKQASLAGILLFSTRSLLDTLAAFSDESYLLGALIQGGIALLCAVVFFLL